jgi:hypothetical protein
MDSQVSTDSVEGTNDEQGDCFQADILRYAAVIAAVEFYILAMKTTLFSDSCFWSSGFSSYCLARFYWQVLAGTILDQDSSASE